VTRAAGAMRSGGSSTEELAAPSIVRPAAPACGGANARWEIARPAAKVRGVQQHTDHEEDIMRIRFAGYLTIGVMSAFLIVTSYAFVADTFWWIALIGGIVIALVGVAEVAVSRRPAGLVAPAGLTEHELVAERDVRHPGTPALP
jgi:hypothetical protein